MNNKNNEKKKKHRKLPRRWEPKYWEHLGEYADDINADWREILDNEEDEAVKSYERYYDHSNSLESMSEELAYMKNQAKYLKNVLEEAVISKNEHNDFTKSIKDKKVRRAVNALTATQKQVIEYYFWRRYKEKEIADLKECSEANITQILSRALEKIAEILGESNK